MSISTNDPVNYTLTHFADHCDQFSHDQINRYLAGDRLPARYVWESVKPHLEQTPNGYIIFDDTILTQVATYKTLDRQTPLLIENNSFFARFRSANCQFASSQAQSNRLCYIGGNLGYFRQKARTKDFACSKTI
ncbi:MAG: hypothetical protein OXM61_16810 [Candidatus Poribacteria bacterium]|nr:hypothetical protein [Candidatus Poribacteria bacterium]